MLTTIELTIYRPGISAYPARKIRFAVAHITQWWDERDGTTIRTACGDQSRVSESYAEVTERLTRLDNTL